MNQAGSTNAPVLRRSFLTTVICGSLGGQVSDAVPAGAAVEFFNASLDVLDDVEDQDAEDALWRKYGQAVAINAATALLMLAQLALTGQGRATGHSRVIRGMEALAWSGARACSGQHRDLAYEEVPAISETKYFDMTAMKSASLVDCACRLGAISADVVDPMVDTFGEFGEHLGVSLQVSNDVESLGESGTAKSDIVRRKKTLPVIFALAHAVPPEREWLRELYGARSCVDPIDERRVLEILRSSGAIHYSLVQVELHRGKALSLLKKAHIPDAIIGEIRSALSF